MKENKETPEERRERVRQEERQGDPLGNLKDSSERAKYGSLVDLVGGLNWKVTLVILLILIIGVIGYGLFF
ncbi:DUF6366 family protein [Alkalibacillus almallahensis]|uniref:DUF6366 family protein n=1 Tax=Alkalibacillus almallahensis TaxID=1379154 RepID=UPI001420A2CE|nr:DUF6366 family protein [Alkalibacillus almallahensis]NIK12619.1 hypothetical protein [Alkalibacillus almallahensis]